MKKTYLLALVFSVASVAAISNLKHFTTSEKGRQEELYANDEEGEGAEYNFKRLRNPYTNQIPADIRRKELAFAATLPKADNNRSTTWQNRGPYNLGGRTRALALDVADENIILAGQVSGGMWRSTDGGAHFTSCTQPQQLHSVSCVAQDKRPGKTNVWYYGTGEQYGIVNAAGFSSQFSGDGIFKSTDGGVTWSQLPSTMSNTPTTQGTTRDMDFVWELVTDASNASEDEVYAATVNGIWRSINGGTTWSPVLGLDTSISQISDYTDIAITSTGVLYATISYETPSKGIWRSEDGVNWTNITPSGFAASYERIEIGIAPGDENQVYFLGQTPGSGTTGHSLWKYNYLSGNGTGSGGRWSNRTANIPDDHCLGFYTFDFRKFSSQSSYDLYIAVLPTDTDVVFLGGTNIFRATDGFKSGVYDWIGGYQCDSSKLSNYVYPNHHPDQHRLIFSPSNPLRAYSSNDGGLMKTDNIVTGQTVWELMNNDYNTGQFYACAIEPGNTNSEMIVGGLQDNGSFFTNTLDYTKPWPKVFYGDGGYAAIAHNRSNYYLSWQTGKIFKFDISDNGTINNLTRIDPTGAGSAYLFIAPFILDPLDDNRMYLDVGRSIYRNDSLTYIPMTGNEYNTINQGWTKLAGSATGSTLTSPSISTLDMSEENTNILYYGSDNGRMYRLDSCRTNNLATKIDITGTNFPVGAYVSCVEVDRLNHNNVLVTFSNYGVKSIFYSTDAGTTWTDISGNLEEHPDGTGNGPSVTWGHIYNDGTNTKYYIGTSTGLYSTEQLNGTNTVWAQEGANTIGNVVINMITSRTFDQNIVVATHGNGMYSNKVFTPSAINSVKADEHNWNVAPNPTTGQFTINVSSELIGTEYSVYNTNGQLITRGKVQDNSNPVSISNQPAGMYLVHVKNSVRKILKQ